MTILLLGATGYLGANIACRLVEEGYEVICVVRLTSDTSRLESLGVEFVLNNLEELELLFRNRQINWVINGMAIYKANDTLYGDMLNSNIIFPLRILNLAVKYSVKNFITIGTSLPKEVNLYSFTKEKFAEFGEYLSKTDGINFANLRLEMFYGGMFEPKNRFLSSCKEKMIKHEPVLLTAGNQKRDIIRVVDVVNIIVKLVEAEYVKGYMVLPVGSGEQYSIKDIMVAMKRNLKSESELKFGAIETREKEPDTLADISWYADIHFKLSYDLYSGLKEWCNH